MDRHSPETQARVFDLLDRFPITQNRVELIAEVGSTAHNISAGSDDLDLTAIWTERLVNLMALDPPWSTKMLRTADEGARSQPGDIDLNVYSMRKFVALCVKGNPSILNTLFIPEDMRLYERTPFPREELATLAHTKSAGAAFLGYMDSQLKRWQEGRVAQRVNRSDVVEKYGFDVKYAAHAIRLGIQGGEFLATGKITIPMDEKYAEDLRRLRRGEMDEAYALWWAEEMQKRLRTDMLLSDLPKGPDYTKVYRFLVDWHESKLGT